MLKVILIGASHRYQCGCMDFRELLKRHCAEHGVQALAEEVGEAALARLGFAESVCQSVSRELGLIHQLSDASPESRQQLGIRAEQDIEMQGFYLRWSPKSTKAEVRKSHDIREHYWLEQLQALNVWPMLFFCGANHFCQFAALLRANGNTVIPADSDWAPCSPIPA